ncbi:MAG: hypothetical protein AAGI07_15700 [Bacteroidota bacterium]
MKWFNYLISLFFIQFLLTSCLDNSDTLPNNENNPDFIFSYDFASSGKGDWQEGFAEYPLSAEDTLMLEADFSNLPSTVNNPDSLLRLKGIDPVGDLFSFIKIAITGLTPSTVFDVVVEVEVAAENLDDFGTTYDSAPEVHLKAGVFEEEPVLENLNDTTVLGFESVVLNINKGNDASPGADLIFLGTIKMPSPSTETPLLVAAGPDEIRASSDAAGNMWLLVGTDSESIIHQAFYYSRITALYYEIN